MRKKKILLCVTGSIAAYKAPEIVRLLQKQDVEVKVIMSKSAMDFITPFTFQVLINHPPYIEPYTEDEPMLHINLAKWADAILIAPVSANSIAKIANGISDELIPLVCQAFDKQIYIAPAMNKVMWSNYQNQRNIKKLSDSGQVTIIGPDKGEQACGDVGLGAMSSPEYIIDKLLKHKAKGKVLVTAGATQEQIDPVRFISNYSSGKMGYEIAKVFEEDGYDVHLVTGKTNIAKPAVTKITEVITASDMLESVMSGISETDVFIAAAAVCDYKAKEFNQNKLKKNSGIKFLELVATTDILAEVGQLKKRPLIIGFAAETCDVIKNAQKKLEQKKADLIIANKVSAENNPFNADESKRAFVTQQNSTTLERKLKTQTAREILSYVNSKRN